MSEQEIIRQLELSTLSGRELREKAMALLSQLEGYDWSGVYRLEGQTLHLDAFCGAETEHTAIPVGQGVCGTAVSENRDQVISDVRQISNYLSCSAATRSEVVVLIRNEAGQVLGQIDIDGHQVGRFKEVDRQLLGEVAVILGKRWSEPADFGKVNAVSV